MTPKSPPRRYSQRPILNSRLTTQFAHTFTTTQTCNPNLISLPFQRLYSILPWTVQVPEKDTAAASCVYPSQLFPQFNLKNSYKHPCKEFLQTPLHLLRSQVHIKLNSLSLSLCAVPCKCNSWKEEDNDRRGMYYIHTKLLVSKPSTSHMCILSWLLAAHHLEEAGNQSFTSTQTRHGRTTSSPIAQSDARKFLL